jgi:hypothetical protein
MLPEVLAYDPTRPASFPCNGRTLTDDAADVFLATLKRDGEADKVGPHNDLLADFPTRGPYTTPEEIRSCLLLLETQLPLRDFRNLSTCTIFCGGLSYGHKTT